MRYWKSLLLASGLASATSLPRDASSDDKLSHCPGYTASNVKKTGSGLTADLKLAGYSCNAYGSDLEQLTLEVTYETDDRIHVKIQDRGNQVYQVPESIFPRPTETSSANSNHLKFNYKTHPFSFSVSRADTGEVLFDTSAASLVFESQYLRLRTSLPDNPYLYGLGEHSDPFRLNTTDYIRTIWNQDSYGIPDGANLYGAHPIYLEQRASGAHGVLLVNSNGMDIMINNTAESGQYLEYNTLGGVLDFYFMAGPAPIDVIQQYTEFAGRAAMQPYWSFGFHQCRYGYQDAFDVAEMVYNYSQANIPLETAWTDIDYMDGRKVFTLDPQRFPLHKMRELVNHLHSHNQHYVVMVDPAVAYQNYPPLERGMSDNIFLLRSNGSAWLGVVWPGVTVFPDWFSENIGKYWDNEFAIFFDKDTGLDIDALWIDMNEPSNFPCNFPCDDPYAAAVGYPPAPPPVRQPPRELPGWPCDFQPGGCSGKSKREVSAPTEYTPVPRGAKIDSLVLPERAAGGGSEKGLPGRNLLYPEYAIHNAAAYEPSWNAAEGGISNHTVNTNIHHQNGLAMYDTHNLYGTMMSSASHDAMVARRPGLRGLVITRSTFLGAGSRVGHWLGDNLSTWDKYRESIRTQLGFASVYGFNMVGSDVCGYGGDTTEELCARWASLGAFSPFYRNHNNAGQIGQEFYRWPTVADSARKAIDIRYRLLDYIYTASYRANSDGSPILNPVFYLYPEDQATWALELEFFFGSSILVAPVTDEGATSVDVYLPKDLFYNWYTHEAVEGTGATYTFANQDTTTIPLLIRSGSVLPLRAASANTTTDLRKQPFEILVALDAEGNAEGELYLDDGESIEQSSFTDLTFSVSKGVLSVSGTLSKDYPLHIAKVTVLKNGYKKGPGGLFSQTKNMNLVVTKPQTIKLSE